MPIDWNEIQKQLKPIPNYEDLIKRLRESSAFPFVQDHYNFTMLEAMEYTRRLLEEDTKQRYCEWAANLESTFQRLQNRGIRYLFDLITRVDTRESLEAFVDLTGFSASEIVSMLRFMLYWVLPKKMTLRELVEDSPEMLKAIAALRKIKAGTNLELLEAGHTPEGRRALAEASGVPEATILDLVQRADFSRMPYSRGATVCNYKNAGYASLAQLAATDLQTVLDDFDRYGAQVGKNLKIGMEVDNGHHIANHLPKIVQE
jgi:hypothetical protein